METTQRVLAALSTLAVCAVAHAQDFGNVQTVVTGLTEPVSLSPIPGDDTRLVVAEHAGKLRLVRVQIDDEGNRSFVLETEPFLDLAALDEINPFFRGPDGEPLQDQSGTVVPRLVRHGGLAVLNNGVLRTPLRDVEQGFYSVAFAPDYQTSGLLYVNYTQSNPNTDPADAIPDGSIDWDFSTPGYCNDHGRSAIVELRRDPENPDRIDPTYERLILAVPKPFPGHNGGTLRFGRDGYLYFGLGDGGSPHDEENRAINPFSLFGKMLRIDVRRDDFPSDPSRNYGIPPTNPYANGVQGAPEIVARGLRNPWRWSFDRWNGDMWIGDVGDTRWEEINYVPAGTLAGRNFGWRAFEGNRDTGFDTGGFDGGTLTAPVYSYPHSAVQPDADGFAPWQSGNCTTGGVVYRGAAIRQWCGRFVFADTYSWRIWSAQVGQSGAWTDLRDWSALLTNAVDGVTTPPVRYAVSINEDNDGELYICELVSGRIRRVVPEGPQPSPADLGHAGGLVGFDGALDNNDFIAFITLFFANDPRADLGKQGGFQGVDQRLDNNDFIAFISAFFADA